MSLNDTADAMVAKKTQLLEQQFGRYAMRSVLAGVYLTLGTAFSAVMAQRVENLAPGLGGPVFAMFFFIGLATIVLLGAELATGNMMYMVYGLYRKTVAAPVAVKLLVVCTVFNLVGALLVGFALGFAEAFSAVTDSSFVSTLINKKLHKDPMGLFVEGIVANFVVNMGMVGVAVLKDYTAKFFMLMFVIGMFVGLGTEHVIANFSLVNIVGFSADPLPEFFTASHIAINWTLVWLGNFVGGGVLIGLVYAWLNDTKALYRD
ncbi:formate/nitrite transporter family protein [Corynebacterium mustelae]|uniref:Formate/nitrite transporter family protein n=1 Tax=Corynebacterium mustelae TaxID=571915 RepID=A0A0G3GUM4_9CORY|nr:formate/nitrite transporter family protein [Corynebacterium mustelae]AKK04849.1 formate/nitrite transporter family protein [Corynebacterium mustelae]